MRGIEHGNLLDDESIELLGEHDVLLTMNLVTYWALLEEGRDFGLSHANWDKTHRWSVKSLHTGEQSCAPCTSDKSVCQKFVCRYAECAMP